MVEPGETDRKFETRLGYIKKLLSQKVKRKLFKLASGVVTLP